MSHKQIMQKIKQSKARIASLQGKLDAEKKNHAGLLLDLQNSITDELGGSSVTIVRGASNAEYDRDAVVDQISSLRRVGTTYAAIARILNTKGYRTLHGKEFTMASVTQLHQPPTSEDLGTTLGQLQIAELEQQQVAGASA